jgi:SAM-dependent methyltransferase
MDWAREFYSRTGAWWGGAEARISPDDHQRVAALRRHAGEPPARVLELGAGYGGAATLTARAGYAVTAVELGDRADYAARLGSLQLIKDDFYTVRLEGRFHAVSYWDGFGVGTDADQRRLLGRIATEWFEPDGVALIDVYNPLVWSRWHGDQEERLARPEAGYPHHLYNAKTFDPVTCTATDTWWDADRPDDRISQRLRCYTPADLALLLEGTGLELATVVADDLLDQDSYLAVMRRAR